MKTSEVLQILRISRATLYRYVAQGLIRRTQKVHHYDYNDEDVYVLIRGSKERKNYLYARVSTAKQKTALQNQLEVLKQWTLERGPKVHGYFSDIASGINFVDRSEFFEWVNKILNYKVDQLSITHKDRLLRIGFDFFKKLFVQFGTEIIIISEIGNEKLDTEDIFEEIVSLLHCYSMKLYSRRRNNTLEIALEKF